MSYPAAKRVFDRVCAAAALLALTPVLLLAALAIRLSSPGPVLYRATRAGLSGTPFAMFKFRTMRVGSDAASRITAGSDTRIFPVGRVLRRLKLDELPQLVNVLRGEMSIVGPRPEDVSIVEQHYTPWMMETLEMAPGITSPGALHGTLLGEERIGSDDPEHDYVLHVLPLKLALELNYVRHASMALDLQVVVRTLLLIGGRTTSSHDVEVEAARQLLTELDSPLP
ncbi:MAG TPA: sugar transferase [Acidimicrobiales bacterium]|nr:sugar transferase [Acidimicrobiales bacterium]